MKKALLTTSQKGMSLVEVLLSIALLVLYVTAMIGGIIYGNESLRISSERARGLFLAEEGLEAVRDIKASSFANLTDGTYGLAIADGKWSLAGSPDISGGFTRSIVISTVDPETKQIESKITWAEREIVLDTYLSDWANQ